MSTRALERLELRTLTDRHHGKTPPLPRIDRSCAVVKNTPQAAHQATREDVRSGRCVLSKAWLGGCYYCTALLP